MSDVFVLGSRYVAEGFLPPPGVVWSSEADYPGLLASAYRAVQGPAPPVRIPHLDPWYWRRVSYHSLGHPSHGQRVGLLQGWEEPFAPDPALFEPGLAALQERFERPYRFFAAPAMQEAMALLAEEGDEVYDQAPRPGAAPPERGPVLGVWVTVALTAEALPCLMKEIGAFAEALLELQPQYVLCDPLTRLGRAAAITCLICDWPYRLIHQLRSPTSLYSHHAVEVIEASQLALTLHGRADVLVSTTTVLPQLLRKLALRPLA